MISPDRSLELLRAYTATRCGAAFRELVAGWSGMVHATARRAAGGEEALAEDITQTVFSRLAAAPEKVRDARALGAWLHAAATGLTLDALRSETRRRRREEMSQRQLMIMTAHPPDSPVPLAGDGGPELTPEIDAALGGLPPRDSQLLIMRFWQQQDWRSIGHAFGLSDDAAQKRMGRALERLRRRLARRGITSTAGALSAMLAGSVPHDPAAAAVLKIVSASGTSLPSVLTTAVMTTKTKAAVAAIVIAATASLVYQQRRIAAQREEIQSLKERTSLSGFHQKTPSPVMVADRIPSRALPGKTPPAADPAEPENPDPSHQAAEKGLTDFDAMNRGKLKEKLAVLRTRLSLTPEQETAIAQALEHGQSKIKISPPNVLVSKASPEDIRKMEEAISATLTPAQRTEYASFREEEKANALEAVANRELSNLQSMVNLTQEQKDQVFAIFSEIAEKESALPVLEPGGEREAQAIKESVDARWEERREALSAILTPEQMAVYNQAGSPYRRGAGG